MFSFHFFGIFGIEEGIWTRSPEGNIDESSVALGALYKKHSHKVQL